MKYFTKFFLICSLIISLASVAQDKDCNNTSIGAIPITELLCDQYLGFDGGLYPNRSNTIPLVHGENAVLRADLIQPLDINGIPDPTGKAVFLSVGVSNTTREFQKFITVSNSYAYLNRNYLEIVDGAYPSQIARFWISDKNFLVNSGSLYGNYTRVRVEQLEPRGLSEKQVQVIWMKLANIHPTISLPSPDADAY